MGKQLLFCVETDKKCNSDWIYIKSFIERYCEYDRAEIKLEKAYMKGKGNYCTIKFKGQIDKIKEKYKKVTDGETIVIYCFDCDDYDINPTDKKNLEDEEFYCKSHNYEFVWFCKDIERVFIGEKIQDSLKKSTAENYVKSNKIANLDIKKLKYTQYNNMTSNLVIILNKYMKCNIE